MLKKVAAFTLALVMLALCGCAAGDVENPDDTSSPKGTALPAPASPTPAIPKDGGVLRLSLGPYDSINPLITGNEDIRMYMSTLVCETFVYIDENMVPKPGIFKSWTVDDSLTIWEFTIEQGVKFHSGTPVEPVDVKNVIDYIVGFGGNYAESVENVTGCSVKDENTIQILLKKPDALFVNKLAIPLVGWQTLVTDQPTEIDGTGIFKVMEISSSRIYLAKHTLYRDQSKYTHFDAVDISVFDSEDGKINSDFDFCLVQGTSVGTDLMDRDTYVYYYRGNSFDYIAINCTSSYVLASDTGSTVWGTDNYISLDNPFSDKRMRQMLNLVTSRDALMRAAASDHGVLSLLPLYSGSVYRKQISDGYDYSPDRASSLLRDIGYEKTDEGWFKNGEEIVIRAICPKRNYRMLSAMRMVADAMRGIGLTVEVSELSDEEYLTKLRNKEFMIAAVETDLGTWQDCSAYFETAGRLNFSFYTNGKVDDYLKQIRTHSDPAVISAAYAKIEEIVLDECPIVGLFISDNAIVVRSRLKGVRDESLKPWAPLAAITEWWIE